MMKKKKFTLKPYDASFKVCVGSDEDIIKYNNKVYKGIPEDQIEGDADFYARTITYSNGSFDCLIIIEDYTPSILAHELIHGIMHTAKHYGLKFMYDNQEPIAYLFGEMYRLSSEFIEKVIRYEFNKTKTK